MLERGARRRRPDPRRDRPRRRRPLPPAARRARGRAARRATGSSTGSPTHDLVGLEAEVERARGLGADERETLLRAARSCAAAPRCSTGAASWAARPSSARPRRLAATFDALARARRRRPGPARPRPAARPRLLHRRDPRGLRPGARPRARRRRPLRRPARAASAAPLPAAGFALYLERVHVAQAEEERLGEGGRA